MKLLSKISLILSFLALIIIYFLIEPFSGDSEDVGKDFQKIGVSALINKLNHQSEWDASEQYRITRKISIADELYSGADITLVTQTSLNNLRSLLRLCSVWDGPVSVSVFSKGSDALWAVTLIYKIRQCYPNVFRLVTFHLVTHEGSGNVKYSPVGSADCLRLTEYSVELQNYDLSVPYPVNLMRNVARKELTTDFFLLIDIDMVPNANLRDMFLKLLDKSELGTDTIYILPAFELEHTISPPISKDELTTLVKRGDMRPFYAELCSKCQSCVDYSSWLNLPANEGLSIAYRTDWSDPCEPFYIGSKNVPEYDESFKQYGFNRISQVCELYVAGYKFAVLDNAFLVHEGMKVKDDFHSGKETEQEVNRKLFREFKQRLKFKYRDSPRTC